MHKKILSIINKILIIIILFFLITPVFIIIPMSFNSGRYLEFPPSSVSLRWYEYYFSSNDWISSTLNSIQIALYTTLLSLTLGIPTAYVITRNKIFQNKFIVSLFSLPIILPLIITAVSLYYFFSPIHLVGSKLGLVVAHTLLALPVVIYPMIAALRRFDIYLEWQSLSLGASPISTFFMITLPLLKPAIITVSLFAFITSFDEIMFAIFLCGGSNVTLPKKIWEGLRFEIEPTVAVVSTFLITLSSIVISTSLVSGWKSKIFS